MTRILLTVLLFNSASAAETGRLDMSVRAEDDGFPGVSAPDLGIELTGIASTGRKYRFSGKAGPQDIVLSTRRVVKLEHGNRIETVAIDGEAVAAVLARRSAYREDYVLTGYVMGRSLRATFDPEMSSEATEFDVRATEYGLRARTRTVGKRSMLAGDFDPAAMDEAGLAVIGVGLALVRLDPPRMNPAGR